VRILFWPTLFWPQIGGVEVLGAQLVQALRERGHEVVVLTRRDPPDLAPESELGGVRILRFPFGQALERRDIEAVAAARAAVVALKREFRPDVVHVFGPSADLIFHRLSGRGTPTLVSLHSPISLDLEARDALLGRAVQDADWLTGCSAWMLESLRQRLPVARSFSSVIPNALPTPAVPASPASFEPPRVLMIGRLTASKGFDLGLQAVARVLSAHPGLRLTVAGDGQQRGELERQAQILGLGEVVEFPGWVDPEQVPELISASSVVVMPSRSEPFGLVALQAAQMQRALVGFAVGGLPEVVSHGVTGLLARRENVEELAEHLGRLLAEPRVAAALATAAVRRARSEFSWENHVGAYEALYERLARAR
jgi:glycogen(starch) synthase